jgi:amino acid transporter
MTDTSDEISADAPVTVNLAETDLKAGALRLPSIFMQSLTMVGPGIAALFYTPVVVSQAGLAAPLAYPIAFLIVLVTAIVLAQLARAVPSAGGYFTYVSRGIHPRAGFLVSWLNIIYAPLILGALSVFGGYIISSSLNWTGTLADWFPIVFSVVVVTVVAAIQYVGVQMSGKALVIAGGIELIIVLLLGLWGLFNPGPGGLNIEPFKPSNASSLSGLFIAAVFAIQAFTGWEGSAPMAEESENPRKNIPRALIGSVILFGIFIVIVQWGIMVGWGTSHFNDMAKPGIELPGITLAKQFWGGAWMLLLFMLVASVIAVALASANMGTRMWYRMGVDGAFPKWFAHVHPKRRTPTNAIVAQWVLSIATAVGLTAVAYVATPSTAEAPVTLQLAYQNQYYMDGYMIGYVVLFIYTLGNIAAFMLYRRERRDEFNWILHVFFPVLSTLGMLTILLFSLNIVGGDPLAFQPGKAALPAAPFNYAVIFVGIWFVAGLLLIWYLKATHREDWMEAAALGASERPATPDELEVREGEW